MYSDKNNFVFYLEHDVGPMLKTHVQSF